MTGNPDFTYHNKPEKRAEIERDGFITSGDVGYIDQDGYVSSGETGRARTWVISGRGQHLSLPKSKPRCIRFPGVHDCAVFGIPDEEFGEALMAVVEPQPGATLDIAAIRAQLKTIACRLQGARNTSKSMANMPREDSGKIFKRRLRDPHWERAGRRI